MSQLPSHTEVFCPTESFYHVTPSITSSAFSPAVLKVAHSPNEKQNRLIDLIKYYIIGKITQTL